MDQNKIVELINKSEITNVVNSYFRAGAIHRSTSCFPNQTPRWQPPADAED